MTKRRVGEKRRAWARLFRLSGEAIAEQETGAGLMQPVDHEPEGNGSWLQRRVAVWLLFAVAWTILACLGAWFNYQQRLFIGHPISWREAILVNVIAYGAWALVLTPIIMAICWHFPLDHGGVKRVIPIHVVAGVLVGTLDAFIRAVGWTALGDATSGFRRMFISEFLFITEMDLWNYWVVAGVCHGILYYTRYIDREKKALRLQNQLVTTELQLLKMQLQPHFLFNTLHTIAAMVHVNPDRAEQMISQLGDLLRMTLEGVNVEEVTVKRELDFLQRYLDIQQTRFQERLRVRLEVEPQVLDACIPYLLLQPLVENAVFYGVARSSAPGMIEVEVRRSNGDLCLAVRNDGPPCSITQGAEARSGLGLNNTRARLSRMYGDAQELRFVRRSTGGAEVMVRIPFKTEAQGEMETHAFAF
jgi:two-component system, LytTR family, sensor kinase